jgi:UDP-N-acetyl-D-mannosaminuronic acid transferase (WecB/TagA/CpsF family)
MCTPDWIQTLIQATLAALTIGSIIFYLGGLPGALKAIETTLNEHHTWIKEIADRETGIHAQTERDHERRLLQLELRNPHPQ